MSCTATQDIFLAAVYNNVELPQDQAYSFRWFVVPTYGGDMSASELVAVLDDKNVAYAGLVAAIRSFISTNSIVHVVKDEHICRRAETLLNDGFHPIFDRLGIIGLKGSRASLREFRGLLYWYHAVAAGCTPAEKDDRPDSYTCTSKGYHFSITSGQCLLVVGARYVPNEYDRLLFAKYRPSIFSRLKE